MISRELHTPSFLAWYDRLQNDKAVLSGGAGGRVYDEWRQDAYNGGTPREKWNAYDHEEYARQLFDDAYALASEADDLKKALEATRWHTNVCSDGNDWPKCAACGEMKPGAGEIEKHDADCPVAAALRVTAPERT